MEGLVKSGFIVSHTAKKRRSNSCRRPKPETPTFLDRDLSPSSSTPPSESASKVSVDKNTGNNVIFRKKEISLNSSASWHSLANTPGGGGGGGSSLRKFKKDDEASVEIDYWKGSSKRYEQSENLSDLKNCSDRAISPLNSKSRSMVEDGFESQSRKQIGKDGDNFQPDVSFSGTGYKRDASVHKNKLRKVKLKVVGLTHAIHAESTLDSPSGGSNLKSSSSSDAIQPSQKLMLKDNAQSPAQKQQKIHGKNLYEGRPSAKSKLDSQGNLSEHLSGMQSQGREISCDLICRSKRVSKKHVLDDAFDNANEDDEIRCRRCLRSAKKSMDYDSNLGHKHNRKQRSLRVLERKLGDLKDDNDDAIQVYGSSRTRRGSKKKLSLGRESKDIDYFDNEDENEGGLDMGLEVKRKKQRKEFADALMDGRKDISRTTRQWALQSGKDASGNATFVEFPSGLPPVPPRKQKEKPSEVEWQLKKAEAAQRRRMQNERVALESQKVAIRKILGHDSSRKKREDAKRKQQAELAQKKAVDAMMVASNTIRWVLGPNGTTVTFPQDAGLPSIFGSKPCSYPPPREKCAGPSCTNVYKYRDSKLKLPLCSLQCYRAIREMMQQVTTC